MSSVNKNLSQVEGSNVPSAQPFKFGIVYSEWNSEITMALKTGAEENAVRQWCFT